jgi:FHS family glucose/mannose:H+ symporter-like MFS transporter
MNPQVDPVRIERATVIRAIGPVFCYFFAAGIATVMLGPLLPGLIQHWHIQDAQAGTLFTANYAGQLCGAWVASRNLRASIVYGALLSAIGCAAMVWANFGAAHAVLFGIGIGLGAGLTAGNIIAGTIFPSARARLLSMLNVLWGIGAVTCPILIHLCGPANFNLFFLVTSACLALSAIFAIATPSATWSATSSTQGSSPKVPLNLSRTALIIFAITIILYIGIENTLGGWLPSYAVRTNPSLQASTITLYFWIAELTGRLLVTAIIPVFTEAILYRICAVLFIATEALLCTRPQPSAASIIAFTAFSALTLAPLYPLIIAFLLARTGNHPNLGPLFSLATIGGATLPWLTGVVSTRFGDLRAGLAVPAICATLFLAVSPIITAKALTTAETSSPPNVP